MKSPEPDFSRLHLEPVLDFLEAQIEYFVEVTIVEFFCGKSTSLLRREWRIRLSGVKWAR